MAGTNRKRLHLTDSLIRAQVLQVAPAVTRLTGWNLGLDTLGCRVLPKDRGYEELLLGRLGQIGLHDWQDLMPDFLERMLEYLIEQNTLAAYLPGAGEILVMQENVDDSNLDGLRLVLADELVHRGQHLAHSRLISRLEELLRQAFAQIQSGDPNLQQLRQIMGQIQPIMTLLESHAAYVQGRLKASRFPEARIRNPTSTWARC